MPTDSRAIWAAAVLVLVLGAWAFLTTGNSDRPAAEEGETPPTPVVQPVTSSDSEAPSFEQRLDVLRAQSEKLQLSAPEELLAEARRQFVNDARSLGEEAIKTKRPDRAAELGRILMEGGEGRFAEAFLQRCMGLLKPSDAGKDHVYPLAQLRRADGRALEAASLYERAIDVEPTIEAEYVGLSDLYLAADRIGPARAAVSRGLRKHPDSTVLKVQGAKVAVLDGKAQEALKVANEVLTTRPEDVAAQLVQIEAQLALGAIADAKSSSDALRNEYPADAWGWIFGGVVAAAKGQTQEAIELLEQAAELAGNCPCTHEERLAIAWARNLKQAQKVAPRSRAEEQKGTSRGASPPTSSSPPGTSPELR